MKGEEGLQIGLAAFEKITDKKSQHPCQDKKDHNEHVSQRRREITGQLAAADGQDVAHRDQAAVAAGSGPAVVISRKTSSSRLRSTRRPVIVQPRPRARSAISATTGRPPWGNTISPSPSASLTGSTAATPGRAASSARMCESAPPAIPRRTAL